MNQIQQILKDRIIELCSVMSVSGFEKRAKDTLYEKLGGDFDEIKTDPVGNHIFIKRCGKENAPLCLVDAHFDEVGMMVTDILDGGFLKFTQIGGLSLSVLQAADVIIYGRQTLRGVIISTPPHLRDGSDKLAAIEDLLIDTGYSKEALEEITPIGTPVGFAPVYREMLSGTLVGKSFDNKACGAVCAEAIASIDRSDLSCDVALMLSSFEETSRLGGVSSGVYSLEPDYAVVTDVNLARVPDTKKYETVPLFEGISIAFSTATDRALTLASEKLCKEKDIPHTMTAAPSSTGTNSPTVNLTGRGVPVVDIGLPLKNMHTYNELISIDDAESLYRFIREFVMSKEIAEFFKKREEDIFNA